MLQGHNVPPVTLFSDGHPVVNNLAFFVTGFMNKEAFCINQLQGINSSYGPSQVSCFVQLQMWAHFMDVFCCTTALQANVVVLLKF